MRSSKLEKMQHQKSLKNNILTWEELKPGIFDHSVLNNQVREKVWEKWVWQQVMDEGLDNAQEKFFVICRFVTVCQLLYEFSEIYYCQNYTANYDNSMSIEFLQEKKTQV